MASAKYRFHHRLSPLYLLIVITEPCLLTKQCNWPLTHIGAIHSRPMRGQCGNRGNVNFVLTEAQTVLKWSKINLFLHLSEKDFDFACEQAVIIEISNQSYNNYYAWTSNRWSPAPWLECSVGGAKSIYWWKSMQAVTCNKQQIQLICPASEHAWHCDETNLLCSIIINSIYNWHMHSNNNNYYDNSITVNYIFNIYNENTFYR